MVENALRHLTDKRRQPTRTGKVGPFPPAELEAPAPPAAVPASVESLEARNSLSKLQNAGDLLSGLGKVTTKGTAPVLLPHPGKYVMKNALS